MLNDNSVRELIRDRHDALKFTWEEIAERSGVSVHALFKFAYGQTKTMKFENIVAVLDALGIELKAVYKESGRKCSE